MANKKSKVTKVDNKKKKQKSRGVSPFVHWLFYWIKSWFSNERCIEAREFKGWSALLIAFAAVILACVPNLSARLSTDAGSILNTPTYNLDNSLVAFQQAANENNLEINISSNTLISINNFDTMATETLSGSVKYWAHKYNTTKYVNVSDSSSSDSGASASSRIQVTEVTVYDLLVFRCPSSDTLSNFMTNTLTVANDPNKWYSSTQTIFATNAIVIGDTGLGIYKATENLTSASSLTVSYQAEMFQGNLIQIINNLISSKTTSTDIASDEYRNAVVSSYKEVIVAGYENTKFTSAWAYTGVAYIINTVMLLVFGLTIFLMTRGKNNPYRDYTFFQCLKIVGWASFSPALLSLIAFIPAIGSSAIGLLIFVLLLGVRTMWMSMRNLRPIYE